MASVAKRMRAEFEETSTVNHHGGKGATREDMIRGFLARYLPRSAEATGPGEIITADGHVSPECDIMIIDRSTPPLMDTREFRIVPAECVHGVVEVKSRLDGRELLDGCKKIQAVKSLPKTVYGPPLEAALRTRIAPAVTLAGQLDRLTAIAGPPNLELGIIPFDAPVPVFPLSGFRLYDDLVIVEHINGEQQLSDTDDVTHYENYLQMLRDTAVHGDDLVAVIRRSLDALALEAAGHG
jgi:hypothetical protein